MPSTGSEPGSRCRSMGNNITQVCKAKRALLLCLIEFNFMEKREGGREGRRTEGRRDGWRGKQQGAGGMENESRSVRLNLLCTHTPQQSRPSNAETTWACTAKNKQASLGSASTSPLAASAPLRFTSWAGSRTAIAGGRCG